MWIGKSKKIERINIRGFKGYPHVIEVGHRALP